MSQKPLLLFAHRGEAQSFLRQAKPLSAEIQSYESPGYFLLITQEGIQETTENTTWFLAQFHGQVSHLINLGIAGALNSKDTTLELEKIYSVKTIYAEEQFKSFSSHSTGIDLITAKTRVTNLALAQKLSMTAPLVDREAWAMASVAKKFKKDFLCYKLVSDFANHENICDLVKEKAETFSDKLYGFYQSLVPVSIKAAEPILTIPGFHFTFTQEKQYETLLERLSLKGKTNHQALIEKINLQKITPKEKAQALIQELTFELNPFKKVFEHKLQTVTMPLTKIGCRLKFTENYENKNFTLSMPIENEKNLQKLQEALKEISYAEISQVLDGEF